MKSIYRNKKFDREDNDILWFLGVYFGDGSIRLRGIGINSFEFSLGSIDRELIEKVADIVERLRRKRPKITSKVEKKTLFYRLDFGFTNLLSWMYKATKDKTEIPKYIWKLPKEKIAYFLAGYFDTDGYVSERKRKDVKQEKSKNMNWCAGFTTVSCWVYDMEKLFNKAGVQTGKLTKRALPNPNHRDRYDCGILMKSLSESRLPLVVNRKKQRISNYISYQTKFI